MFSCEFQLKKYDSPKLPYEYFILCNILTKKWILKIIISNYVADSLWIAVNFGKTVVNRKN